MFKTLQRLFQSLEDENVSMGAVVAEDESRALRHLKLCASERKIPMMVGYSSFFFSLSFTC